MGASPWEFSCSVCQKSCDTHNGWLLHLLLPSHQKRAKRECKLWSESDKERVVVAFSAAPVVKDAFSIVNDLSSVVTGTIVTDLILWTDRPRVAFIQFESKNKVAEMIPEVSQMVEIILSTCRIQVKRATDLIGLEWQDFLHDSGANKKQKPYTEMDWTDNRDPRLQKTSPRQTYFWMDPPLPKIAKFDIIDKEPKRQKTSPPLPKTSKVGVPSKKPTQPLKTSLPLPKTSQVTRKPTEPLKTSLPLPKTSQVNIPRKPNEPLKTSLPLPKTSQVNIPRKPTEPLKTSLPFRKTNEVDIPSDKVFSAPVKAKIENKISTLNLGRQCYVIHKEMAIPHSDFSNMLNLLENVKSILQARFSKCKLHLFRHWYLRTRNCGTNQLLIFLDLDDIWGKSWDVDVEEELNASYQRAGFHTAAEVLEMCSAILLSKNIRKINSTDVGNNGVILKLDTHGNNFFDENSGIIFGLFNHTSFILETQTSRLVKYLSSFDPRVVPLISFINYWAKLNKVIFAPNLITELRVSTIVGAEPSSLEWLVLSFLSRQRVIPFVRKVLENPHDKLMFRKQDIGFCIDMNFSKKWAEDNPSPEINTDEFIKSILVMARDFFQFYGDINPKSKILNTKDGELLEERHLIPACTKLSVYEQKLVKETLEKADMKHVIKGFKILHPLCISCFLSFSGNYFENIHQKLFKGTAVKLREYLKTAKVKPEVWSSPVDFKSLLLCDGR